MIGTVLSELKASALATLSSKIGIVATLRGVDLDNEFTIYDWWKVSSDSLVINFPALGLAWDPNGTKTGQRDGSNGRVAYHRITVTYTVRSADEDYVRRHILFVPEAIVLWLEDLPTASRAPGTGKTIVGLDRADGKEIEITHDLESVQGGALIWSVDVSFTLKAKDQGLPARTT